MNHRFPVALALAAWLWAPAGHALTNQLTDHPSPYLAMHASDPVAWQDWGAQAVDQARREQKLLYLSIGYFSCHWCHVMQHESYRDEGVAALLNANFIPVKVDRELEPALDARMIEFAEATQGRAGWPLNVFLTPDGHPLYAVLYLPKADFAQLLGRLDQVWRGDRANLAAIARREASQAAGPGAPQLDAERVRGYANAIVATAKRGVDPIHGGFGRQMKFPSVPQLDFLLGRLERAPDDRLRELLRLTLDQMAANGLQDHLGGGFFRYTVDPAWETPHFEKMLYDNALLSRLYLRAGRVLGRPDYVELGRATLDFMLRDMAAPAGAMVASFSAVDADNVEGGYYLWDETALSAALREDERDVAELAFRIQDVPPFEAGWLPMRGASPAEIAAALRRQPDSVEADLQRIREKLLQVRQKRILPTDTKLLAGWNGLALASLAEAARTLGDAAYRAGAAGVHRYLMTTLWSESGFRRAVDGQRPIGSASLEDYAYALEGLLAWARLTGEARDYEMARDVAAQGWKRFYSGDGWNLAEHSLIVDERGRDLIADGPMPSPSGVMARVSLELAAQLNDSPLRRQALAALNSGHEQLARNPFWFSTQVDAMLLALKPVD